MENKNTDPSKAENHVESLEEGLLVSKNLAKEAYKALDDRLGKDIRILDVHEVSVLADYFIICSGESNKQVQALTDNVEEKLSALGYPPEHVEGYRDGTWILMDFGRIIVHIFNKEARLFYDLERIWSRGKAIEVQDLDD